MSNWEISLLSFDRKLQNMDRDQNNNILIIDENYFGKNVTKILIAQKSMNERYSTRHYYKYKYIKLQTPFP